MEDNVQVVKQLANEFYPYSQERLGFDKPARIKYADDVENSQDPLGMTAYYNPEDFSITLFTTGRHPKDILRSLSHELVHHAQNCRGEFLEDLPQEEGYAQDNDHLREMEKEAYEQGNLIFRDWEDSKKKEKKEGIMEHWKKRHEKVNDELMKRWGFKKPESKEQEPAKNKESKKEEKKDD